MTRLLDGTDPASLDEAAALLRAGKLVAFPTETVYGLGAAGTDEAAVARAFAAKGRPADNPVILHVATLAEALALWRASADETERARLCAAAFWPGPLTLVLAAADHVPHVVTAGLSTVAVRVPDHPVALALLARTGCPLAAPSANASGRPSPTCAAHVERTLAGRIDAIVDGGETRLGLESTVLDLRGARPRILRAGGVTHAQLVAALGDVAPLDPDDAAAHSPGRRHRHYAPEGAAVSLVSPRELEGAWRSDVALLVRAATAANLTQQLGERAARTEVLPDDAAGFARALYSALYRLEGEATIALEDAPAGDSWTAVRDRLRRAAGGTGVPG